jgi:hypothetical protein
MESSMGRRSAEFLFALSIPLLLAGSAWAQSAVPVPPPSQTRTAPETLKQRTDLPTTAPSSTPPSVDSIVPTRQRLTPPLEPAQQAAGQQQTPVATPPAQPLGTGAAPDLGARGVPASRPAGAVIAPAKQKRISVFSVRTALLVGGVVALGVVTGLTLGTPSRPN